MHDAKMLYLITQHSSWARKNHPFLLCKCNRGNGVVDENHVCEIIDHDNQLKYFDRSKKDGKEEDQSIQQQKREFIQ